jgi:hypothetical protein
MTDYKATLAQWAECEEWATSSVIGASDACILELRARVEVLEDAAHNHIVETSANILALANQVEALDVAKCPASKVYEINEPLQLTPEQAQQVRDLLAPNSKPTPNSSQIRSLLVKQVTRDRDETGDYLIVHDTPASASSLVERVGAAILEQFENNAGNEAEARAAIREVAAWMREQHDGDLVAATVLEQEAER